MSGSRDPRLTWAQNFWAGGIAAILARTATAPLEVLRVLRQVGTGSGAQPSALPLSYVGLCRGLVAQQGASAFWRGNLVGCLRVFPFTSVQFAGTHSFSVWLSDENGALSPEMATLAGSGGRLAALVAVYPLDVIKTRLTTQEFSGHHAPRRYEGIGHAFRVTVHQEGYRAFSRGLIPAAIATFPFALTIGIANSTLPSLFYGRPRENLDVTQVFATGCVATALAQTVCYPLDTIKVMLQAQHAPKAGITASTAPAPTQPDVPFRGAWDCAVATARQRGVAGLWRGNVANLLRVGPYNLCLFLGYEASRNYFLAQNGF